MLSSPLPCSTVAVSPEGELLHMSGAPFFVTAAHGMPLDCLSLEARGEGLVFLGPTGL